jgi:hypothetical protein
VPKAPAQGQKPSLLKPVEFSACESPLHDIKLSYNNNIILSKENHVRFISMLFLLGACGSVSLSTIAQLSRLNPLSADPSGFVAAVVLPNAYDLPENSATLGFTWVSETETLGGEFAMRRHGAFAGGSIELGPDQHVLFFDLAPADAAAIRQAQQDISQRKNSGVKGEGSFSVFVAPCEAGADGALLISTYLRIEEGGPFLPLLRNLDIRQEMADGVLPKLPSCG